MKIQEMMKKEVRFCGPSTNLAEAASMMWTDGCGTLPVVDEKGNVTGMITDRDICIALGTRDVNAAALQVKDVSLPKLFSCEPEDDIHKALEKMAAQKVRRLPVIDARGTLKGILSIDDVVLYAQKYPKTNVDLSYADVVLALQGICERKEESLPLAVHA
jgi:CBS domain-containing protein